MDELKVKSIEIIIPIHPANVANAYFTLINKLKKQIVQGFFKEAGRQILNEAVSAAGDYIGNAIQEMLVVKKQAEHPRILPSLEHMKIVSNER